MSKFKSFLGWFFGIIFLLGAIPYFWCGEFFLGLWSLVVVVVLIPPLYKYASGKLDSPFSKTKTLIFSLVVFVFLFANFVRPLFDGNLAWKFTERYNEAATSCSIAIEQNKIKKEDSQREKCVKSVKIFKACSLASDKMDIYMIEDEKNINYPNVCKLIVTPINQYIQQTFKKQVEGLKKNIKYKWKCGEF